MDQPSYYAILTANVRYDNRLSDSEKIFFAEITALSNKYGFCTASNGYFSKLYDVTKRTVSSRINTLKELGYLRIEFIYNGKEVKQRKIYPVTDISIPMENKFNTPIENSFHTPIEETFQENNTSINNTSINNNISASNNAHEHQNDKNLINEFNEWYELYDKKKDRKAAFTKFKTARKKHTFEQIVNGTKEYLKTINNKQFQKYPKTFLHNESYLEDYSDSYVDAEPLTGNVFNELRNEFK